jgi:hypothetical protein
MTMPSPARATIWIDGAPVTILPRRAPVGNSGPIRGRTLAVFVLPTPFEASESAALLEIGEQLRAVLPSGRWHEGFLGKVEPGEWPGQAIFDLSEDEAAAAGRALGLGEILFWDGRRACLLPCNSTSPPLPAAEEGAGG